MFQIVKLKKYTEPVLYKFGTHVSFSAVPRRTTLHSVFPNLDSLLLSSRSFDDFENVLAAANVFVTDLLHHLNGETEDYSIISEINPGYSGKPTMSTEWNDQELAKIWIVQKDELGAEQMSAVSLTQVFELAADPVLLS